MSLTESSPDASSPRRRLPAWRFVLCFLFAAAVWPTAYFCLYVLRSAPLAFVSYHLVCLAGGTVLHSPGLPAPRRLVKPDHRHLVAAVVSANVVTLLLYGLAGSALLDHRAALHQLTRQGLPPADYKYLLPYFAIVNPLAEEFFWRGGVYATLRHLFSGWLPAAGAASILFGAWHWLVIRLFVAPPVALATTALIMLVGFGLTVVYERTRRLAYPVILHSLAGDAPLLLLLLLASRG